MPLSRRRFLLAGTAATISSHALAQANHQHGMFSTLREPGTRDLPPQALQQRVYDSPAPRAPEPGRWRVRAPLLLPRSEMAWATAWDGRMHVVGGYGEQRVDRPYHHVYIAAENRWAEAAPLPRGGNHVGVVATEGKLYAIGGHQDQNRKPYTDCFVHDIAADRWQPIAPLPRARGAAGVVAVGGRIHSIGGAIGDTTETKLSIDWHDVYDPARDAWSLAAALPTPRSGHGAVLYRGKVFCMGGEETGKVFGQNEAYDPLTDSWMQYAPMLTPRHGLGAAAVGEAIYVAGGGPIVGGGVQSAIHEAFSLN